MGVEADGVESNITDSGEDHVERYDEDISLDL